MGRNSRSRIHVSFDGINYFWIVFENISKKLILSPTEEDKKGTKLVKYNHTNICPICRKEFDEEGEELTDKSILHPGNVRKTIIERFEDQWIK